MKKVTITKEKIGKMAQFFGVFAHDQKGMEELRERILKRRAEVDIEVKERMQKIREKLHNST